MTNDNYANHTLSIYVTNQPGVLMRVAQVFSRRGFNIDSLVVSPGLNGQYSRMTISAKGPEESLEQINRQVAKLIDVVHCTDHTNDDVVSEEMALIKVVMNSQKQSEILQVIDHFKATSVDLFDGVIIIKLAAPTQKINELLVMLKPFDVLEVIRTGKLIMLRGSNET